MKLPRSRTLNDRADFAAVREGKQSQAGKNLVLGYRKRDDDEPWRYAIITSKKAGKAHERVHIRRLIRASLTELGADIQPGLDLVFIARWCAKEATFAEIRTEISKLLSRAKLVREL